MEERVEERALNPREQREQRKLQRKMDLAARREAQVVLTRTNDILALLDIARQADNIVNYVRRNIFLRLKIEDVAPLLQEFREAVNRLHEVTYKLSKFTPIGYRIPRGFEEPMDEETKAGVERVKRERKAEVIESMLGGE